MTFFSLYIPTQTSLTFWRQKQVQVDRKEYLFISQGIELTKEWNWFLSFECVYFNIFVCYMAVCFTSTASEMDVHT